MPELTHHREKSHVKTLAKHPQDGTSILFNWAFCHSSLTVSLRFSLYLCRFPHGAGTRLPIQPAYSKKTPSYTTVDKIPNLSHLNWRPISSYRWILTYIIYQ
jgi:hypothetical protein